MGFLTTANALLAEKTGSGRVDHFRILPDAASDTAQQIDLVYIGLLLISGAVILLLFVLLLASLFTHRLGANALGRFIQGHRARFETAWSVVPLLIFLGLFGWGAHLYLDAFGPTETASEPINVVGRQWMWQMYYPNGYSEHNSLHLPVNEPFTLRLSSEDVIHSFYVPAFRVKHDVVPGRYVELTVTPTKVGQYRLFCAEYCGMSHSQMTGWVHVMEPQDYARWRRNAKPRESFAARGAALFQEHGCSGCHAAGSNFHAPPLAGVAGSTVPLTEGGFAKADAGYLRDSILLPGKAITAGYENLMPSYQNQLSESELAALVAYIQSLTPEEEGGNRNE